MNMSVAEARELLYVPPEATVDELYDAMNDKFKEAAQQDDVGLARRACDAFTTLMVDEGFRPQYWADQYLAEMSIKIAGFGALIDQLHAERVSLERRRDQLRAEAAKSKAVLDRLYAQRYTIARWIAKRRIQRRKFIRLIMSIFK